MNMQINFFCRNNDKIDVYLNKGPINYYTMYTYIYILSINVTLCDIYLYTHIYRYE